MKCQKKIYWKKITKSKTKRYELMAYITKKSEKSSHVGNWTKQMFGIFALKKWRKWSSIAFHSLLLDIPWPRWLAVCGFGNWCNWSNQLWENSFSEDTFPSPLSQVALPWPTDDVNIPKSALEAESSLAQRQYYPIKAETAIYVATY